MGKYGLPYQGSKNKIAADIINLLPPAETFVDLFAGGCAMPHAAMLSGKYDRFIVNDISDVPRLFFDAVAGKYRNEKRWISREDFFKLKDRDSYVRCCWSFGNGVRTYMYAPEIERLKKRMWEMAFAGSPSDWATAWRGFVREFALIRDEIAELTKKAEELCKECGVEMIRCKDGTIDTGKIKEQVFRIKSSEIRQYLRDALKASGHTVADIDGLLGTNGMAGHYFGQAQWLLPTEEAYEKMRTIMPALTVPWAELSERLQSLECLQRLQRLQRLECLQSLQSLTITQQDYQAVELPDDAVIYCDPPYNTKASKSSYGVKFDFPRFYDWLRNIGRPVYVSEYSMPDDFVRIWSKETTTSFSPTNKARKVTEGLWVQEQWADDIKTTLF